MKKHVYRSLGLLLCFGLTTTRISAQDLASFEKRTTVKTLDNGLVAIICERPEAPVFSFFTHVDVGGDREVPGITGLAHMFEHMAFKGTDKIGTKDYADEKIALENEEKAYLAYDHERRKPFGHDNKELADLERGWREATATADKYVVTGEFGQIIKVHGGVGLNAFTTHDETGYFYSLPSNQVELWAYLESERFLHPVLREFYQERKVVHEERRLQESKPFGRLLEQFVATAYVAHPYGQPVVGWPSDLESFSRTDALAYFSKYYVPADMIVALVGDVKASEILPVIQKYFGRLQARPKPEALRTIEPQQNAEKTVVLHEASQPIFIEGYHKPDIRDKDEAVFDAIQDLMSDGRTSRLYRSLVRDKKIAASAGGFNDFPGAKYPNLFVFYAFPTPGHTPEEIRDAIHGELERIKEQDIADEELQMIKVRVKADLMRSLRDNEGIAFSLGTAQALYGDWRELFRQVDRIEEVNKADIRSVANATFVESNRTIAVIESTQLAQSPASENKTKQ